jgi:hypothetical protein
LLKPLKKNFFSIKKPKGFQINRIANFPQKMFSLKNFLGHNVHPTSLQTLPLHNLFNLKQFLTIRGNIVCNKTSFLPAFAIDLFVFIEDSDFSKILFWEENERFVSFNKKESSEEISVNLFFENIIKQK